MSDTSSVGTSASDLEDITNDINDAEQYHLMDESLCLLRKGKKYGLSQREHDDLKKMLRRLREKGQLTDELFSKTSMNDAYEFVKRFNNQAWLIIKEKHACYFKEEKSKSKSKSKCKSKSKKIGNNLIIKANGQIILKKLYK